MQSGATVTVETLAIWIPAAAALLGALVGSLGAIVVQAIQARSERKRERLRLAVELGLADHRAHIERAEAWAARNMQVRVPPVSLFVDYHKRFLSLVEGGNITPAAVDKLYAEHRAIKRTIDEMAPYFIPKRKDATSSTDDVD